LLKCDIMRVGIRGCGAPRWGRAWAKAWLVTSLQAGVRIRPHGGNGDQTDMAGQGNGDGMNSGRAQAGPYTEAVPKGKGRPQGLLSRAAWGGLFPVFFQLFLGKLQDCHCFSKSSSLSVPDLKGPAKCWHSGPSPHAMELAHISEPCTSSAYCTGSACTPTMSPAQHACCTGSREGFQG